MEEVGCEPQNKCQTQTNSLTFKSFTIRWIALAAQLVPATAGTIWPYLIKSAEGAAGQCDGTPNNACGYHWTTTTWDGSAGVGQQMSALSAICAPLLTVDDLGAPLTLQTGGTSKSNPSAGTGPSSGVSATPGSQWLSRQITTGDRAGAGILTALLLVGTISGTYLLVRY